MSSIIPKFRSTHIAGANLEFEFIPDERLVRVRANRGDDTIHITFSQDDAMDMVCALNGIFNEGEELCATTDCVHCTAVCKFAEGEKVIKKDDPKASWNGKTKCKDASVEVCLACDVNNCPYAGAGE